MSHGYRHRLKDDLRAIVHDDACHLAKYSLKRAQQCDLAGKMAGLKWVLDRFHSKGHVDRWCLEHCHPDVHPSVTEGLNTSVCEMVNSLIGRHKHTYRVLAGATRKFFLQEVVDSRNTLAELTPMRHPSSCTTLFMPCLTLLVSFASTSCFPGEAAGLPLKHWR